LQSSERKAIITPESVIDVPREIYAAPWLSIAARKLALGYSSFCGRTLPLPAFAHE